MQSVSVFVGERAQASRRRMDQRSASLGRISAAGPGDFDDMLASVPEIEAGDAPALAFHFTYADARGAVSQRVVTLLKVVLEAEDLKIYAFCHARGAMRCFLASRLREVVDLSTGEVHADAGVFFSEHPMLSIAPRNGSAGAVAVRECQDELMILLFVAACDAKVVEEEMDEVVLHVMNAFPDEDVLEDDVRISIANLVANEAALNKALRRLGSGKGNAKRLWRSVRKVVDADGVVHNNEVQFAGEVHRYLVEAGQL